MPLGLPLSLEKSSMKPINPNSKVDINILRIYGLLKSLHINVLTVIDNNMIKPPIVGVPDFNECVSGPSDLIFSPISLLLSDLINIGPKTNEIIKADKALKIPLVVI